MIFENPYILLLLLLIYPLWIWILKTQKPSRLFVPNVSELKKLENRKSKLLRLLPNYIRLSVITILVIACAQPQTLDLTQKQYKEGINILLVLDLSESMLNNDIKPTRLTIAKKTIRQFVKRRPHDNIGLLVFGKDAFTACPLTTDHSLLDTFIHRCKIGMVDPTSTAIGLAIATGAERLKSNGKHSIMILLTDGMNNQLGIDPEIAIQEAIKKGIKIYTIGVGKKGDYDPAMLTEIAKKTKGSFFSASNKEELSSIYQTINSLETIKIEQTHRTQVVEWYPVLIWLALILFCLEVLITRIIALRTP